jgi:homoserine kinase type II
LTGADYAALLPAWNLQFAGVDAAAQLEGSPERTAARAVLCDLSGCRWIVEQIDEENIARKQQVAECLLAAKRAGLARIHPWERTSAGGLFQTLENRHWMLRPYIDGIPLNRETDLNEFWRIDALAQFLLQLRGLTADWSGPEFSITRYARDRRGAWKTRCPKLCHTLTPSFSKLEASFFEVHDELPVAFCHGDFHPLNVVWGKSEIRSVIDWEFCGIKSELYDVALLLGCIGFENPDNLLGDPAARLVRTLRAAGFGSDASWQWILELAATIRYGWMSEWVRRGDEDSAEMEAVYIDILVDQKEYILRHWMR